MGVLGGIIVVAGVTMLLVAGLPIRMRIEKRATLIAASVPVMFLGGVLFSEAVAPSCPEDKWSWLAGLAVMLTTAVLARELLVWRMKRDRRNWETRWRHVVRPRLIADLFKRYYDID